MTLDDNTTLELDYENPDGPKMVAFGIVIGILAILITLLNGALIIVILLKRKLRSSPKYFIVLNLSIVGFIDGAFLATVQALGWNEWNLPCFIMAAADTILIVFVSVDLMLIISLCIQWIASITIPSYNAKTTFRLVLFLVSVSWLNSFLGTLVYVIPGGNTVYFNKRCVYILDEFAQIGLQLIPAPLLFILFIILILLFVVRSRQTRDRYNMESNGKKFPLGAFLCALVMLFCISSTVVGLIDSVKHSILAIMLLNILAKSRHVLIPMIWLIISKPIRRVILCKREEPEFAEIHDLKMYQ